MLKDLDGISNTSDHANGSSPIGREGSTAMAWTMPPELPHNFPTRPPLTSQQSSSLPSTPYQHARELSFHSRTPSPTRGGFNTSPRSTHSESSHSLPSLRKPLGGGCQYETALAHFRRRMPYSLGGDKLEPKRGSLKAGLDPHEEKKLSGDMRELYDRLLPSPKSDERRASLVQKLESLLNSQWPGNNIKVHMFGSSGNKLCTNNSDVDICITTTFRDLERVCLLADLLAKHGMRRVVCVSHAKVPIVKFWDPELELACDMNVNNPMALENTRMIKTYVEIDDRVRPLAMIVKYWTKRRILNDAALGGTLSSYTWICMIIFFLQNRSPPILPVLQQRPHQDRKMPDGTNIGFDDDVEKLRDFGADNKETIGDLLFQFFRYYGHQIDYETSVISIRQGKLISKVEKGWHLLQNNRLCVEEPFNISRNLGNTADDTSFRGIHLELRRAFELIAEGRLDSCTKEYEYPPEEEKIFERPQQLPRPVVTQTLPQSSKGGKQSGKGSRNSSSGYSRGPNSNRRASNGSSSRNNGFSNANVTQSAREILLQQRHQQFLLHDHLYQQIQVLQAQEQELRFQLALQGRPQPQILRQSYPQFPHLQQEQFPDENARARSRTLNQPPLSAPLNQHGFQVPPGYAPMTISLSQGPNTNPSSPLLTPVLPDLRRSHRRSSVTTSSNGGSLRAQSQPARPIPSPLSFQQFTRMQQKEEGEAEQQRGRPHVRAAVPPSVPALNGEMPVFQGQVPAVQRSPYVDDTRSSGYVGYYLGNSAPATHYRNYPTMSLPQHYSVPVMNNMLQPYPGRPSHSRSPTISPPSEGQPNMPAAPHKDAPRPEHESKHRESPQPQVSADRGPVVVDGSTPFIDRRRTNQSESSEHAPPMSISASSEDQGCFTPATNSDSLSQDLQELDMRDLDYSFYPQAEFQGRDALGTVNGLPVSQPPSIQRSRIGSIPSSLLPIRASAADALNDRGSLVTNGIVEHLQAFPERNRVGEDAKTVVPRPEPSSTQEYPGVLGQLSPVEEIRTPSPTVKRRPDSLDLLKLNGSTVRARGKEAEEDKTPHGPKSIRESREALEAMAKKMNGITPSSRNKASPSHPLTASNGWQPAKRKHRKRNLSTDMAGHSIGGEAPPISDADRKGG